MISAVTGVIGTVTEVWRYPVKSMQGARVDHLEVGPGGAPGDRQWAVVDPEAGKVLSAKRWPALLEASARIDDGGVVVTLPDGSEHTAGDAAINRALSAWLGRDVTLIAPPEGPSLPMEMGVDPTDDTSQIFDWAGPPGTWLDLADIHVLTTASLASAARLHPDGAWDVRRFRPTAVIELTSSAAGDDPWPEDAWVGRNVRLGAAVIEGFMRTVRCAMPTRAQPGLAIDAAISRTLTEHHSSDLGLYANVAEAGAVAEGDSVALA
jgi:uncharacterized protein YcbX